MPGKHKGDQPRMDASGRELFDWEITPGDQLSRPSPDAGTVASASAGTAEPGDAGGK
jgi:hypothetical protein